VSAFSTTSWSFKLYNNPYAEQISLSIAQAQDKLNQPQTEPQQKTTLEMFQDTLLRQLLSRMTSSVINEAFGDGSLDFGDEGFVHYTVGDYDMLIEEAGAYIKVTLTDMVTGDITVMEVPYYANIESGQ
jgi:curli production assembly/transport component CsgF